MTKDIARASSAIYATMMASVTPTCDPVCVSVSTCDMARAAIASLLPPSDEMVEAAAIASVQELGPMVEWADVDEDEKDITRRVIRASITAAINAALGTKP